MGRITKMTLKEKKHNTLIYFPSKILPAFRALYFLLQEEKEIAIRGWFLQAGHFIEGTYLLLTALIRQILLHNFTSEEFEAYSS